MEYHRLPLYLEELEERIAPSHTAESGIDYAIGDTIIVNGEDETENVAVEQDTESQA